MRPSGPGTTTWTSNELLSSEFCFYIHAGEIFIIFFYTFYRHPQGEKVSDNSATYILWQNGKNKSE